MLNRGGGRNEGLRRSSADFVAFLDSDDWLDVNFVEDLMTSIITLNADIAFCDHYQSDNGNNIEISTLGNCEGLSYKEMRQKIAGSGIPIWSAIYRKRLIWDHNLFFPENLFYEDNAICKPLHLCAKSYAKVNKPLYYYRIDNPSTLRSINNPNFFDRLTTAVMFREHSIRLGLYDEFKSEIDHSFLNLYFKGTILGTYEKFTSVPYIKLTKVNRFIWKEYGLRKILSYLIKQSLWNKFILLGNLFSPRIGYGFYRIINKMNRLKHRLL